ncbi:MAG: citrate transporter [Chloroflexi bacterium]|nr:ArsB/NhaD family transporter [Chloroflexota bacterium]MQC26745.1 citrate transporter [Chloroflexota bacterium]
MTTAQIVSSVIFLATFIAILRERVDRTIIGLIGAGVMVAAGMVFGFYSQEEALASIDFNTLGLLLGMMVIVALLAKSGFFQYVATLTAKWSGGDPWRLLLILGTITTVLSMFLDNVTTIVLIVPVTILIAEILGISSIPFLMAEALLSNTGGVATLVGDPPNILIGSAAGLSFIDFLVHLAPIVLVAWLGAIITLRYLFREELKLPPENPEALLNLDEKAALKDTKLLWKVLTVLGGVIVLFFMHTALHLSPAFVALLGAATALLWVQPDVEEILKEVEWSVLLFFGALFVVVGGLEASGLLALLAESVTAMARADVLVTGVVLIWGAAILSSIVDNIPFTIVMIPIIQDLGALGVDIGPLWWALALGAGFGGNGTPIGSTANIITIKLSERTRHPITTALWLRKGLPVMLVVSVIGSILYALTFSSM